jgi:aspartyl-tRNA(Asn)/glutamyl-tRNA(Gln) amidotransferase subunit B
VADGTVNLNTAKRVFGEAFEAGADPAALIAERGLAQVSDEAELRSTIEQVLRDNAREVERFRAGEEKVFGHLIGQVMRATESRANPKLVQKLLREVLTKQ